MTAAPTRARRWKLVDTVTDNGVSGARRERFNRLGARWLRRQPADLGPAS